MYRKLTGNFPRERMAMTVEERKQALGRGGAAVIVRRTKKSTTQVHEVIHGRRRDRRVEVAIARFIRRPVDDVFEPEQSPARSFAGAT